MSDAQRELIEGLNEDLAGEFQAIIHYMVAAEMMTGHGRPELRAFFQSEIQDELGHAQMLAHKIVALGGTPTTQPAPVRLGGSNKEQLQIALEAERETIQRYQQRVKQADAAGEPGLRVRLEDVIADETEHMHELELILKDF